MLDRNILFSTALPYCLKWILLIFITRAFVSEFSDTIFHMFTMNFFTKTLCKTLFVNSSSATEVTSCMRNFIALFQPDNFGGKNVVIINCALTLQITEIERFYPSFYFLCPLWTVSPYACFYCMEYIAFPFLKCLLMVLQILICLLTQKILNNPYIIAVLCLVKTKIVFWLFPDVFKWPVGWWTCTPFCSRMIPLLHIFLESS